MINKLNINKFNSVPYLINVLMINKSNINKFNYLMAL